MKFTPVIVTLVKRSTSRRAPDIPLRTTQVVRQGWDLMQRTTNFQIISIGQPDDHLFDGIPKRWAYMCTDVMLGVIYNPQMPTLHLHETVAIQVSLRSPPHRINGDDSLSIEWQPRQLFQLPRLCDMGTETTSIQLGKFSTTTNIDGDTRERWRRKARAEFRRWWFRQDRRRELLHRDFLIFLFRQKVLFTSKNAMQGVLTVLILQTTQVLGLAPPIRLERSFLLIISFGSISGAVVGGGGGNFCANPRLSDRREGRVKLHESIVFLVWAPRSA